MKVDGDARGGSVGLHIPPPTMCIQNQSGNAPLACLVLLKIVGGCNGAFRWRCKTLHCNKKTRSSSPVSVSAGSSQDICEV